MLLTAHKSVSKLDYSRAQGGPRAALRPVLGEPGPSLVDVFGSIAQNAWRFG